MLVIMSLAGVMYWDMATDVDYTNQLSLLRALNTVMNANIVTEDGVTGRIVTSSSKSEKSINEVPSDFSLYPNPAKNAFTVELPTEQKGCIKIFSLIGQELFTQSLTNQQKLDININDFVPGLYIVKYADEKGNAKSAKLIIK